MVNDDIANCKLIVQLSIEKSILKLYQVFHIPFNRHHLFVPHMSVPSYIAVFLPDIFKLLHGFEKCRT